MPYKPDQFSDIPSPASMAPSELQPPLNFADGGAVNWASDAQIYNTQSQVGNLAATPGGFGGMANQFTMGGPFGQPAPVSSGSSTPVHNMAGGSEQFDYNLGSALQPKPVQPSQAPLANMPPMSQPIAMAEGGQVGGLVSRLRDEFSKRGLSFDAFLAHKLKAMQK